MARELIIVRRNIVNMDRRVEMLYILFFDGWYESIRALARKFRTVCKISFGDIFVNPKWPPTPTDIIKIGHNSVNICNRVLMFGFYT